MTANQAINTIKQLLGMNFSSEKFYKTVLVDGTTEVTNGKDTELEIGDELYVLEDSVLKPAPEGSHETREGLVVTVGTDSVITKIEAKPEAIQDTTIEEAVEDIQDEREDMMSSATLTDGTKIETDEEGDFQVGQKLYVITQEGERVSAPEGEHTTQSGIVLTVDAEGVITGVKYPDEAGEGSLEDMKKMKEAMTKMVELMSEFSKFTKDFEGFKKDFESFKKQPDRAPVIQKFNKGTEAILDWKIELIKGSKK